jgi:hypothetical protein
VTHNQRALALGLAVLLLGILASCGQGTVQIGWVESNAPHGFAATYARFSGSEIRTVRIGAGETLVVAYDATVERGALAISVEDPNRTELWATCLDSKTQATVKLPVEQGGRYAVVVRGDGTQGKFNLWWEVTDEKTNSR